MRKLRHWRWTCSSSHNHLEGIDPSVLLTSTGWSQEYCVPSISTRLRYSYHAHGPLKTSAPGVSAVGQGRLVLQSQVTSCPPQLQHGTLRTPLGGEEHPLGLYPHSPWGYLHGTLPGGSRTDRQVLTGTCQWYSKSCGRWAQGGENN